MKTRLISILPILFLGTHHLTRAQDCRFQYAYVDECLSPTSECFQCIPCWEDGFAGYIDPKTQTIQLCKENANSPHACQACADQCSRNILQSTCPAAVEAKRNLKTTSFVFAGRENRTEVLQCASNDTAIFMIFAQYHETNLANLANVRLGQRCNKNLLGVFASACNGKSSCSTKIAYDTACSSAYTLRYGYYCSPFASGTFPPIFIAESNTSATTAEGKVDWWWLIVSAVGAILSLGVIAWLFIRCRTTGNFSSGPSPDKCQCLWCRKYEPSPQEEYDHESPPPPRSFGHTSADTEGLTNNRFESVVVQPPVGPGSRYAPGRSGFSHELESIPSGVSGVFDGSSIGHSIPKNSQIPTDIFNAMQANSHHSFGETYDTAMPSYAVAHEFQSPHNPVAPWENKVPVPPPGAMQPYGAIHGVQTPKSVQETAPDAELGDIEQINRTELTLIQEIGKGSFGRVFRARFRDQIVAAKKFRRDDVDEKKVQDFIKHEIKLSHQASGHPNVLKAFGYCETPFCLVTECMDKSVRKYLDTTSEHQISMNERAEIAVQAARGILHLHNVDIIHRDIATRNILIKGNYGEEKNPMQVVVSDFGMSRIMTQESYAQTYSAVGPLKWMAPEAIKDQQFSSKSDVYAFGITLWEIITGREPYEDIDAVNTAVEVLVRQRRPELSPHIPQGLCELMQDCWQNDPELRPDMKKIIERLENFISGLQ